MDVVPMTDEESHKRAICSRVTLQAKKEGFFQALADSLSTKMDFGSFLLCQNDMERFKVVSSCCWEHIHAELIFRGKNLEVSVEKRLEGNKYFEKNDLRRALLCYCQSLIQAPVGPELVSTYCNRSALLFKMGEFQAAIDDAEMAISYNSPEASKHKLYERMTACYISLKNFQKAKVTLRLAKHLTEKHDPNNDKFLNKLEKHSEIIEKMSGKEGSGNESGKNKDLPDGISILKPSPVFPCASEKMTVEYSEAAGRFAMATEKIAPCEVILIEEPQAACVNMEKLGSHCAHCFNRFKVSVPCETCSQVGYCSRKCRKEAQESYHQYECKVMALLMGSGMSASAHLALRLITQKSVEHFKEIFSDLKNDQRQVLRNREDGTFDNKSYINIYNLGGLEDQRTVIDIYERTLMAVFLTKCLRLTGYFQINLFKNPDPTEDEIMIGSLILRNLQVLQFNAYEICEFLMESRTNCRKSTTSSIGIAIYATASYFNHSCSPDVTRFFWGRKMIVQSLHGIEPNQAICDNYGPIFTKMERPQRQMQLFTRYWFRCYCDACTKNYPLLSQFPVDIDFGVGSAEEKKAIKKLGEMEVSYFDAGMTAMEAGKPHVAIELYKRYVEEYEALTVLTQGKFKNSPYKTVLLAQEGIRICLCSLGSVYISNEDGINKVK